MRSKVQVTISRLGQNTVVTTDNCFGHAMGNREFREEHVRTTSTHLIVNCISNNGKHTWEMFSPLSESERVIVNPIKGNPKKIAGYVTRELEKFNCRVSIDQL
ncbi:hypothetical protein GR7B_00100 [Vibrio phage vB_VcorM_GR7B]|nr:hypothetical protein GR7B_00100 [Vibrio phage vB_VcorM_GR7B]